MKKRIASIFLTLVLTLSLAGTALAAGTTVTPETLEDKTITATLSSDGKSIDLTMGGLTAGNQYLVLMVSGDGTAASPSITESTIRYIDQTASSDGTVMFKVYPSSMQTSTIYLSGEDLDLTAVATVEVPYVLGDLNNDQTINSQDAVLLNRCLSGKISQEELNNNSLMRLAADVNRNGAVESMDGILMNQYMASKIQNFD